MATKDANVSSQQHSVPRRVGSTLTLCSSRPSYPAGPDCAGNLAGHPICAGGLSHGLSGRQQTTVYVGGFSPDTTATLLHSAFIPFGDILDISLPSDPARKGAHKGFAFITFATPEAALDACDNMHRNCLPTVTNRGRILKVNKAKPPKGAGKHGSNKPSKLALYRALRAQSSRRILADVPLLSLSCCSYLPKPLLAHRQSGPRRSGSQHTALMESANPALERRQRTATRPYKKRREPSTRESRSCSHHLVVTSDARTPGTIRRTWRPKREREKERRCKCECDVGE